MDYCKLLSEQSFIQYEGFDMGRMLYIRIHKTDKRRLSIKQILFLFLSGFYRRSHVRIDNLCYQHSYLRDQRVVRKSYRSIDDNICSLNCGISPIILYYKNSLRLKLKMYYYIYKWYNLLCSIGLPRYLRPLILYDLVDLYSIKEELSLESIRHFKTLTVLFDGRTTDNFFVQIARMNGIRTVTLQHGHFFNPRKPGGLDSGTPFKNFSSDFFIVWSNYTKDEAVLAGVPEKKIKVCGNPEQIGTLCVRNVCRSDFFVLFLDADQLFARNVEMIETCAALAKQNRLTMWVKFHPASNKKRYKDYMSDEVQIVSDDESNLSLLEKVPFIVASGSSIILTAACIGTPVFRFMKRDDVIEDCFPDISFLSFSDIDSGENLIINSIHKREEVLQNVEYLKERLGSSGTIQENYEAFYNSILEI